MGDNNLYVLGLCSSIIFLVIKFLDVRFIKKEDLDIKTLIIDSIITYFSTVAGFFILDQFNNKSKVLSEPPVFLDEAKF